MNARRRGEGGFTLIELLIASALVIVLMSAVAALAMPMRRAFDRGLSSAESTSRARTAMATLVAAARDAGSGIVIGPTNVTLDAVVPTITALSSSTLLLTRAAGPQGILRHRVDAGDVSVRLDTTRPCSEQDATCGIRALDSVVIFDATKGEPVGVSSVSHASATLHLAAPLTQAFDAGAVIATLEHTTFTLRGQQLMRLTSAGALQPIADRVAAFDVAVAAGRLDIHLQLAPVSPLSAGYGLRTSVGPRP